MRKPFTVCVLLYGDNLFLAKRCLTSLTLDPEYHQYVHDFRVGLNNVSDETYEFATNWAAEVGIETSFYQPVWPENSPAYKYPVMRRMLYGLDRPSSRIMWFDDDSYLSLDSAWWDNAEQASRGVELLGQIVKRPMSTAHWEWIHTQPWCHPGLAKPDSFVFAQGAWFVASYAFLSALDWPCLELRHCGGDSMLGELCRHQGVEILPWRTGVCINADTAGRDSAAIRRGYTEQTLANDYKGQPLPTEHQNFKLNRWVVRP